MKTLLLSQPLHVGDYGGMPLKIIWALLAMSSGFGLVFALVGDGIWDAGSWLALGAPLAVIAWYVGCSGNDGRSGKRRRTASS